MLNVFTDIEHFIARIIRSKNSSNQKSTAACSIHEYSIILQQNFVIWKLHYAKWSSRWMVLPFALCKAGNIVNCDNQVLTVKFVRIQVCKNNAPWRMLRIYWCFGASNCLHLQGLANQKIFVHLNTANGSNMFRRNVGKQWLSDIA